MTRTAIVNYHVHSQNRQAFHIDAGGIVGRQISPDLVKVNVPLRDLRGETGAVSFAEDGIAFVSAPSGVRSFSAGDDWRTEYDAELKGLLTRELDVTEVVVFDHTFREDDPASDRKPARNVHSDYSREGAENRLVDILGPERARDWSDGHYAFINVWRPVDHPINSAPLGFIRPASVPEEDWILIDLIYPDRRGHIMGLAANDRHEWLYQSRMTPEEVVFFNIYDNHGLPPVGHSAVDRVEDPNVHTIRKSIESRTVVRY